MGTSSLSAVELLALVVGGAGRSGGRLELARRILEHFGSLAELGARHAVELAVIDGVGAARASALAAAFELGRRAARPTAEAVTVVDGPREAASLLAPVLDGLGQEAVAVLCLGARHQPLHLRTVALGALNSAGVHPREVFAPAVAVRAAALVLAHNHPSGDPEPSEDDVRLTRRLVECGQTLGIEVLDHLVLAGGRWVSLRERRVF